MLKKDVSANLKCRLWLFLDKYGMKECSIKALLFKSGKSSENILHK